MSANANGIKKIVVNLDSLQMKSPKKQTKKRSMIEPNKLKDTFMKQVQKYKSVANAVAAAAKKAIPDIPTLPSNTYTDDFNASIDYLNNIKKTTVHTELPAELIQLQPPTQIQKPMLVEQIQTPSQIQTPMLTQSPIQIQNPMLVEQITTQAQSQVLPTYNPTYAVDNAVPYGCLKNGLKPSFKNWTRHNRSSSVMPMPMPETSVLFNPNLTNLTNETLHTQSMPISTTTTPSTPSMPIIPIQQRTTIKRHVIGKSKKSKHVGVLIKNITTRKNIINAHKDLKKINISEVRTHLKNNGLLKVGSTAPIDVLRQTYESSILAGNITNKSDETLMHNFVNETAII